ncbi:hypothetical protein [Carnobacterium maltaromaticum]|uniref:nSTAND3 domain-containing NTPase n=1 Tax=Carnobacterium maltaromaticum TaxID=2751 RepID=UPI0039B11999
MNIPTDFLTPTDFEAFANRVSGILFNKTIIGFGEGKDDGIDGVDDIVTPTIVIQSKRYQSRTSPSSFVNTAKKEIDKIRMASSKYNWKNHYEYVIITSSKLNPASRKTIRDYAGELMSSDNNIIDGNVLKDFSFIKEYEKVFVDYDLIDKKLIDLLKNNKQECISLESRDYFSDFDSKYFVETEVLYNLFDLLNKERIAVLTGDPGVGKTTMCKMIGNLFSSKCDGDYLILERNIDEIQNVIEMYNLYFRQEKSKKLFIVFDDFLGRTVLDTSERQIKKLRMLYSLVSNSDNLYVLLNSRTQILNAAKNEDLEFGKLIDDKDNKKVTIDISKYSPVEKARIFRKNIEFEFDAQSVSEKKIMNTKYCELINGKKYRTIVNHRNFNPRLIGLIASQSLESKGNYFEYCTKALSNPSQLYEGLFKKLSDAHKLFLVCLYCFEEYPILLSEMENSFVEIIQNDNYDLREIEQDLEESWIVIKNDESLKNERIDFANPSIIDFISIKKTKNSLFLTISKQTRYLSQIVKSVNTLELYNKIESNYDLYYDKDQFIGERISILLEQEKITDISAFIGLLYKFSGKYHRKNTENNLSFSLSIFYSKNDWGDLVSEFYFSKNTDAKNIFLKELLYSKNNDELVRNVFNNCSDIDNLAEYLDFLLEDVYDTKLEQNELIDFAEEESGLNLYSEILYNKEQRIQEMVDDYYEIESFMNFDSLVESEDDKQTAISRVIEEHQNNINQQLSNTFFEDQINNFDLDFSGIEEFISEQIDEYLQSLNDDSENNGIFYIDDVETIDTILEKPLM